jgi:RimJ/RimL family protein N-acetyltransferase
MHVLSTERLSLRWLTLADAGFLLALMNLPVYWQFIGDRGVRSVEDVEAYMTKTVLASYAQHGFSIFAVERQGETGPVGICGLLQREFLPVPDLAYALSPSAWGSGYAVEAAAAVVQWGLATLHKPEILAIVNPDNTRSIRVLDKLGMRYQRGIVMPGETREICLYSTGTSERSQTGEARTGSDRFAG